MITFAQAKALEADDIVVGFKAGIIPVVVISELVAYGHKHHWTKNRLAKLEALAPKGAKVSKPRKAVAEATEPSAYFLAVEASPRKYGKGHGRGNLVATPKQRENRQALWASLA